MGKDSPFIGVKKKPEFKYSFEVLNCFGRVKIFEKLLGHDLSTINLLSYFGITEKNIKLTKLKLIDDFSIEDYEIKSLKNKYSYVRNFYIKYRKLTYEECIQELSKLTVKSKDVLRLSALFDAIENKKTDSFKIPERLFKHLFYYKDKEYLNFYDLFKVFSPKVDSFSTLYYFEEIKDIILACGIDTFAKLRECSPEFVYSLFLNKYESFIDLLESFDVDLFEKYSLELNKVVKALEEQKLLDIFKYRNSINLNKKLTLEEIGKKFKFTRERARQIESYSYEFINKKGLKLKNSIKNILILDAVDDTYIVPSIKNKFKTNVDYEYFKAFLNVFEDLNYFYDKITKGFINKNKLDGLYQTFNEENVVAYSIDEFESFDIPKKYFIVNNYNLKDHKVYLRKGHAQSEFILRIFDDLYPNGAGFGDSICVEIKDALKKQYDIEFDFISRNLQQYLVRNNYCTIDRGIYINRKYISSIDDDLKNCIINYVYSKKGNVTYRELFEEFKDKLAEKNINNWFYLKGLIDPLFPSDIVTTKAYCSLQGYETSMEENYDNLFKKYKGILSCTQFKNEHPGSREFHLINYVVHKPNIIFLSNKRFLNLEILPIENKDKEYLKDEIENMFIKLNTDFFKISKLYSKFKILDSYFLAKYSFIINETDLMKICKKLFENDYFFGWNVISKNKFILKSYDMVYEHFNKIQSFSTEDIKKYCTTMHIFGYNLQDLITYISDYCVQISQNNFVNKYRFANCEQKLKELSDAVEFYITNYGEINTQTFKGYIAFPSLFYQWNQYFLIGLTRCFFKDELSVEIFHTGTAINYFLIRRINKI